MAHKVTAWRSRALWWATGVAEVAVMVQVIAGVTLQTSQDRKAGQFHEFYGYVAFVTVGLIYAYRAQLRDKLYLLYGFGGLFLMGLGIRAMLLGPR